MADSYVCSGAMMKCTMGTSPARLTVLPNRMVFLAGQLLANISDNKTMVNLAPFGLCRSLAFPPTASATSAAMGTLTPMPCMHNTPAPWMGGKMDYIIKGQPALLQSCKCQCMWGGTISLINNGQVGEGAQGVNESKKGFLGGIIQSIADKKEAKKEEKEAYDKAAEDLAALLKSNTDWFVNPDGFQKLTVNEPGHNRSNGYTRLDGNIYLKKAILKDCINAFKKIQKNQSIENEALKEKLTRKEERSLATLWHEINHNMHSTQYDSQHWGKLSDLNKYYMETANEFVARKTLPDFYEALGGEMSYPEFMNSRENTGYNPWVLKYEKAIEDYDLDESVVIDTVKQGLYEGDYHKQKANLINGLIVGGQYVDDETKTCYNKITPTQAKKIVDNLFNK